MTGTEQPRSRRKFLKAVKDQDTIEVANRYGIAMVFTGVRHFLH